MSKCPMSKDGKCESVYGFRSLCDGYSSGCSVKPIAEEVVRVATAMQESVMNAIGIRPNGR